MPSQHETIAAVLAPSAAILVAGLLAVIMAADVQVLGFAIAVWFFALPWQLIAIPLFLLLYAQLKKQSMPRGLAILFATGICTLLQAGGTLVLVNDAMSIAVLVLGPLSGCCFALLTCAESDKKQDCWTADHA